MKKQLIEQAFTSEFIKDPTIIFELLDNISKNPDKNYELDTYGSGQILTHEIDYLLNESYFFKIVKDWESLSKLHNMSYDFPAIDDGKVDLSIFSDVYSDLGKTGEHLHFDNDYDIYYDPQLHDKSDWRS